MNSGSETTKIQINAEHFSLGSMRRYHHFTLKSNRKFIPPTRCSNEKLLQNNKTRIVTASFKICYHSKTNVATPTISGSLHLHRCVGRLFKPNFKKSGQTTYDNIHLFYFDKLIIDSLFYKQWNSVKMMNIDNNFNYYVKNLRI